MMIKDVKEMQNGQVAEIVAVLVKNNLTPKNGGGNYLQVAFKDASGTIEFPVFDNAESISERLKENEIYTVKGVVNIWNGNFQIKSPVFRHVEISKAISELGSDYFLPSYSKRVIAEATNYICQTIADMKEPYKTLVATMTGAEGINHKLFCEFQLCPSAEKHHGAKLGGLIVHTHGVLRFVDTAIENYIANPVVDVTDKEPINADRARAKAIIHDLMKMNEYEYSTAIRRKPGVIGHLIDGCSYLESVNKTLENPLSSEEIENLKYSILSHHGQYGPYEPKTTEDQIIHLADMMDSRMVGEIER